MAFRLGNFSIDEIIEATAEDFDGNILYALDQLSQASIEISSESTEITDKKGNVVRTIYKSKSGTFNATNAFLNPQIMAAGTGSAIKNASASDKIVMPKIEVLAAGAVKVLDATADEDTIQVLGLYGSGANGDALTKTTGAAVSGKYAYDNSTHTITLPAAADGEPINYLVKYDREVESGISITNTVDNFPATVKLTLYCSYVDPCDDELRACYVVLPSFQASPETTVSLSADEQEMDFNGSIQVDYCAASPALYYIYIPDENAVKTGVTE